MKNLTLFIFCGSFFALSLAASAERADDDRERQWSEAQAQNQVGEAAAAEVEIELSTQHESATEQLRLLIEGGAGLGPIARVAYAGTVLSSAPRMHLTPATGDQFFRYGLDSLAHVPYTECDFGSGCAFGDELNGALFRMMANESSSALQLMKRHFQMFTALSNLNERQLEDVREFIGSNKSPVVQAMYPKVFVFILHHPRTNSGLIRELLKDLFHEKGIDGENPYRQINESPETRLALLDQTRAFGKVPLDQQNLVDRLRQRLQLEIVFEKGLEPNPNHVTPGALRAADNLIQRGAELAAPALLSWMDAAKIEGQTQQNLLGALMRKLETVPKDQMIQFFDDADYDGGGLHPYLDLMNYALESPSVSAATRLQIESYLKQKLTTNDRYDSWSRGAIDYEETYGRFAPGHPRP